MTYLNLIQDFEIFATTYPTIGTFSHGEIPDLNGRSRSHNDYPLFNVRMDRSEITSPNNSQTQVLSYFMEVVMLDVLLQNRQNEVYIINNFIQIARDLYTQPFIYNNLGGGFLIEPGPYYLAENLFGIKITFEIQTPLDFCI